MNVLCDLINTIEHSKVQIFPELPVPSKSLSLDLINVRQTKKGRVARKLIRKLYKWTSFKVVHTGLERVKKGLSIQREWDSKRV